MKAWTSSLAGLAALAVLLDAPGAAGAGRCDDDGVHGAAVAAARAAVVTTCDCAGAESHAAYVACAWSVIQARTAAGELPAMCRSRVRQFASKSTCGREGFVTCCIGSPAGRWRAATRRAAVGCVAPRGGSACVSPLTHLQYACAPDDGCRDGLCGDGVLDPATEGCEPPGTSTCDEQCRTLPACGNGDVDYADGEECEPPGTATCDAACRYVHTCGNGVVELGEECDGQSGCDPDCRLGRSVCCDFDDACFSTTAYDDFTAYWNVTKPCIQVFFGQSGPGICEGPPCPDFPPLLDCRLGSCGDQPIDPLPLCCQRASGGCDETVATTAGAIASFNCSTFPPPEEGDIDRLMIGTCGGDGRCVPGG